MPRSNQGEHDLSRRRREKPEDVHVAQVVRHKGPIVLPDDMETETAIGVLQRKLDYDVEEICISETVPVFPWDGALALAKALEEQFGMAQQQSSWMGMAGQMSVEVGPNETRQIPQGQFQLPGINGFVETATAELDGRTIFRIHAHVQHRSEAAIRALIERTREIAKAESIYRGQAIQIRFRDEDGDPLPLPTPAFLTLTDSPVVFNRELEEAIETNLLTPIRFSRQLRENGIPLKRGALLAGKFGTGKTLTANWVARVAVENGWTFIYVTDVEELAAALKFAQAYQPAVVFAEDIDRMAGLERTDEVNDLLNMLDGIGNKGVEIITILTSNKPDLINSAMRRPGRIDLVLPIDEPDAEAVVRLLRLYGSGVIRENEDLTPAGEELKGQIPAVIREVVERSKLEALKRSRGQSLQVLAADLVAAAKVLKSEQELFKPKEAEKHPMRVLGEGIGNEIGSVIGSRLSEIASGNHREAEEPVGTSR